MTAKENKEIRERLDNIELCIRLLEKEATELRKSLSPVEGKGSRKGNMKKQALREYAMRHLHKHMYRKKDD